MNEIPKSMPIIFGLSVFGISGYMFYQRYKKKEEYNLFGFLSVYLGNRPVQVEKPDFEKIAIMPSKKNWSRKRPKKSKLQFEVIISWVEDPSRIWIRKAGPESTKLDELITQMVAYYEDPDNRHLQSLKSVKKGDVVALYCEDDTDLWYRAEVLNVDTEGSEDSEGLIEMFYLDYGGTGNHDITDMCILKPEFLQLNFQAIECYLADVAPPSADGWDGTVTDQLDELAFSTQDCENIKCIAVPNGFQIRVKVGAEEALSPIPGVDLYLKYPVVYVDPVFKLLELEVDDETNIAEKLVDDNMAIWQRHSVI